MGGQRCKRPLIVNEVCLGQKLYVWSCAVCFGAPRQQRSTHKTDTCVLQFVRARAPNHCMPGLVVRKIIAVVHSAKTFRATSEPDGCRHPSSENFLVHTRNKHQHACTKICCSRSQENCQGHYATQNRRESVNCRTSCRGKKK